MFDEPGSSWGGGGMATAAKGFIQPPLQAKNVSVPGLDILRCIGRCCCLLWFYGCFVLLWHWFGFAFFWPSLYLSRIQNNIKDVQSRYKAIKKTCIKLLKPVRPCQSILHYKNIENHWISTNHTDHCHQVARDIKAYEEVQDLKEAPNRQSSWWCEVVFSRFLFPLPRRAIIPMFQRLPFCGWHDDQPKKMWKEHGGRPVVFRWRQTDRSLLTTKHIGNGSWRKLRWCKRRQNGFGELLPDR